MKISKNFLLVEGDYAIGTQEYLVTNCDELERYLSKEIGTDYESEYEYRTGTPEWNQNKSGSVTVFDLTKNEHDKIRKFITDNKLWSE